MKKRSLRLFVGLVLAASASFLVAGDVDDYSAFQEARKLEKERDINRSKDPYFEYAEVLLQIAIVMASVSIIAGSRAVFSFSALVASLGAVMCANGYLQIFELPFLH